MTVGALGLLGLDGRNQLYWDGKPVEIKRTLTLDRWQIVWAVVIGIGTLIGGIGTGVNESFDFGCKVHLWSGGCRP